MGYHAPLLGLQRQRAEEFAWWEVPGGKSNVGELKIKRQIPSCREVIKYEEMAREIC